MAVMTPATALVTAVSLAAPAHAANPYERGPNPTDALLEASSGPFSVSEENVSRLSASGFGGGTIYYPRENNTYGAVAISPGYTGTEASIAWLGERIASHGFVVITIDTITTLDQPDSRAEQLNAALNHMINRASSTVRSRIDSSRLAVMGHSMGGGGTLRLASQRPDLKAAIPLTPWHLNKNWSSVTVPTLIIGADLDTIAPVATHAKPFYSGSSTTTPATPSSSAPDRATDSSARSKSTAPPARSRKRTRRVFPPHSFGGGHCGGRHRPFCPPFSFEKCDKPPFLPHRTPDTERSSGTTLVVLRMHDHCDLPHSGNAVEIRSA